MSIFLCILKHARATTILTNAETLATRRDGDDMNNSNAARKVSQTVEALAQWDDEPTSPDVMATVSMSTLVALGLDGLTVQGARALRAVVL